MTHDPNTQQQKLIDSLDGIYKVDAGAGTGKTFTVTRRYINILETKNVDPEDILLLTFTKNAADEMKERIINHCDQDSKEIREAPISTFHSLSKKIVNEHGFDIPKEIGVNDSITSSTRVIENAVLEKEEFESFFNEFIQRHPEYDDFFKTIQDYTELLDLIKSLGAKGVIPKRVGWYRDTGKHLDGNMADFKEVLKETNKPRNGGSKQSYLNEKIGELYSKKLLTDDAPEKSKIRYSDDNAVDESYTTKAFQEKRSDLKEFIHDVYFEYIEYALSRNYLNFSFILIFGFILICENDELREELSFEYSMIDEFQDTNEIQFKLALLLSKGNIAAVGDWKQSIYSFQHTEVENILDFKERLNQYKKELNQDKQRIDYTTEAEEIDLVQNYRSTQKVLDFSETALTLEGKDDEEIDEQKVKDEIVSLETDKDEKTRLEKVVSEDEIEAVLQKIESVVGNEEYEIEGDAPEYSDIAVLSRNRSFGLELQKKASEYNIPLAYEGEVELFKTNPSIILLAWLRVLEYSKSDRGWAVILEQAGYKLDEVKKRIRDNDYPESMISFRKQLEQEEKISNIAQKVFARYGYENGFTEKIIHVLQETFDSSYKNMGELIRFIERNIEEGQGYKVDDTAENAVTVQTIHSAKGLEYPIVFVSNINQKNFPSNQSSSSSIIFEDPVGIRNKKKYVEEDQYVYTSWKASLVTKALPGNYDEERRLMYVAMTRAEQHLIFTAEKDNESKFFTGLRDNELEKQEIEPSLEPVEVTEEEKKQLELSEVKDKAPLKKSVHSVMDLEEDTVGRGKEFGEKVHLFAERYAKGEDVEPSNEDEENVKQFIDSLEGELRPEVPIKVPSEEDGRKIVYSGVIDLLYITEDEVEIIDWKTDRERDNREQYEKQLEIYEKGVEKVFGEREVERKIFWTKC